MTAQSALARITGLAMLVAACATVQDGSPDVTPGEQPEPASVEADFWMITDNAEKQIKESGRRVMDPALNAYVRDVVCAVAGPVDPHRGSKDRVAALRVARDGEGVAVVGLLGDDLVGDLVLAAHGTDGHDRALERQQIRQFGDRGDLIRLVVDLARAQDQALSRGLGRDPVDQPLGADPQAPQNAQENQYFACRPLKPYP